MPPPAPTAASATVAASPGAAVAHAHARRDAELGALLQRTALGQASAFEQFYDRTVAYARALARRTVAADDVDDALADAYLDAWRHADRFDPARGSPVTWLLTLVHARAVDMRRRARPAESTAELDDMASTAAGPVEQLWLSQSGRQLHAALARLSAQERWVLGLAYFRDLSHGDIAETTGLPLGTVKSLILRAHAKLRTHLSPNP